MARESLCALDWADELRQQHDQALGEANQLRHEARQLQHELQVEEVSLMVKWSAGFYNGFDTLVKVAKGEFLDVDLTNLKAKDYAD